MHWMLGEIPGREGVWSLELRAEGAEPGAWATTEPLGGLSLT